MSELWPQDAAVNGHRALVNQLRALTSRYPNQSIMANQHVTALRRAFERKDVPVTEKVTAMTEAMAYMARIEGNPPIKTKAQVKV